MSNSIEIKGLSFSYKKDEAVLNNINIKIKVGSISAILGKNGSGKSTLLDCIIGYNKLNQGSIYINGSSIKDLKIRDIAKNVSYISQKTAVNIDYSVIDFIAFGRTAYLGYFSMPKQSDYDIAIDSMKLLGILKLRNKLITEISGGERQLVYIARALTQNTPILIMDEPTSALDFGNQARLFSIFKSLQSKGKTIIFTTHNPNHVLNLKCDTIVLVKGEIATYGDSKDVLNDSLMKTIYGDSIVKKNNGQYYEFNI